MTDEQRAQAAADAALQRAETAFATFRYTTPALRARLLETIADAILGLGDDLLQVAHAETHLGIARLTGERGRTVAQLRAFAELVREGSWVEARIDSADPKRTPPRPDLRRLLVPLGPVVVFAASNFPLAFSVAGGDTASALAAGNPVVLKAHPAHPQTSERVAAAVRQALARYELPAGAFTLVDGPGNAIGLALVRHPLTRAVAFTGSLQGGRALFDAAAARPEPIPVYAEMGSVNPVFVLPAALAQKGPALAQALADSATLGVGQFCTKPGLIFVCEAAGTDAFVAALGARVSAKAPASMLYEQLSERFQEGVAALGRAPGISRVGEASGESAPGLGRPVAWQIQFAEFAKSPQLSRELFGPSTIVVRIPSGDLERAAAALEGQLTATIHAAADDAELLPALLAQLERKVGRLIFGGVPTGVEVAPAMNHGGPYPASTDARTTSVGTAAIARFARPLCYQDASEAVLPRELHDQNTLGIWRLLNGQLSQDDVGA
ncbi:MAG TPA: aldehyde dehydrogenase (NADP(+)) [Polyangiaceae bacterium]|nr:aldehyde dehydrogenase (NADP(+)) [Polyangiaceae bacterium]